MDTAQEQHNSRIHFDDLAVEDLPAIGTFSLYAIDFSGYKAIVVARDDRTMVPDFVFNISGRQVPLNANEPWIIIGRPEFLENGDVFMPKAAILSPSQFYRAYLETNYHPVDIFRAALVDVKFLQPNLLTDVMIGGRSLSEAYDLGDEEVRAIYAERERSRLLREVLSSKPMKERMLTCVSETVMNGREHSFSVFRHPLLHDLPDEFVYTFVTSGDHDNTLPNRRWRELLRESPLINHFDVAKKYGFPIEEAHTLFDASGLSPEMAEEVRIARENEWSIFMAHKNEFIAGDHKRSVIEHPDRGAGYGYYRHTVVHTHPFIDSEGNIEPSSDDLKMVCAIREDAFSGRTLGYAAHERILHSPVFIILQPSDTSGKNFYGLIYKAVDDGSENAPVSSEIPDDNELVRSYAQIGVLDTLKGLGFVAQKFKFSRGRYSPLVKTLSKDFE